MRFKNIIFFFSILFSFSVNAQNMEEYTDSWEGKIEDSKAFNLKVEIENLGFESATFKIYNSKNIINHSFNAANIHQINIPFAENLFFEGILSKNNKEINGFIKSGFLLYHLKLTKSEKNSYVGDWNILMVDELKLQDFYLSVENGANNAYEAYPIFADSRFTGTWCDNFQKENDVISFSDFKTGLQFKGKLVPNKIQLGIFLGNHLITEIDLKKSTTNWKIGGLKSAHKTSILQLTELEKIISKDSLPILAP